MLNKLIGYELRATRRVFLPAYAATLIFTIITRILMGFNAFQGSFMSYASRKWLLDLMATISTILMVSSLIAIFVLSFVYMIVRFYRNLLRDEGYLMFTLPVKTTDLIWSKCIVSTLWIFASVLVAAIALFILCTDVSFWQTFFPRFREVISIIWAQLSFHSILFILEILLLVIFSLFTGILFCYLCLSLGQLSNKNRIILSIAAYIAISTVLQFIGTSTLIVLGNNFNPSWLLWLTHFNIIAFVHMVLFGLIVLSILETLVCAALTNRILTRRLNLE